MLFAEVPPIVVDAAGLATAGLSIAGAIIGSAKLLLSYLSGKDKEHREQVVSIVTQFATLSKQQHEECKSDKQVLLNVVESFHETLGELKDAIRKP